MRYTYSSCAHALSALPTATGICGRQAGSSSIEFTLAFAALVPFFVGIPLLAKYADIKNSALQASRYAAWERTVYSDPDEPWRDGEAPITKEELQNAVQLRFFGHSAHAIHSNSSTENPLWRSGHAESLIQRHTTGNTISLTLDDSSVVDGMSGWAYATARPVEILGAEGLELNGAFGSLTSAIGDGLDVMTGAVNALGNFLGHNTNCSMPGVNLMGGDADGGGIGLSSQNLSTVTVAVPLQNHTDSVEGSSEIVTHAAILANPWTVPSDPVFAQRIDNLVPNQMLGCITAPGTILFGSMGGRGDFLFGEGRYGSELDIQSPSNALPD